MSSTPALGASTIDACAATPDSVRRCASVRPMRRTCARATVLGYTSTPVQRSPAVAAACERCDSIASRMLFARSPISRSVIGGELIVNITATESPKSLFRTDCVEWPAAWGRSLMSPSLPRMSCQTSSACRSVSKSST